MLLTGVAMRSIEPTRTDIIQHLSLSLEPTYFVKIIELP